MLTKDELGEEEFQNFRPGVEYENYSMEDIMYPSDPTIWKDLYFVDVLKVVAYAIIIVGGLLGNTSVILTVALNRSMRTTTNLYVANLAVADAMICIICMVPQALSVLTEDVYVLGEFMCKFNPFTQMMCLTSSVLTLSAISWDRLVDILFRVRVTKQRPCVVMTVVWIVSMVVSVPLLVVNKFVTNKWSNFSWCEEYWPVRWSCEAGLEDCGNYAPLRALYYMVASLTLFFLPLLVMITAYSLILCRLWLVQVPGEQHDNIQFRARKKDPDWLRDFKWFSYYIAFANSFLNPIIYAGYNKTFREEFRILLRCGNRRNKYARLRRTFTTSVAPGPSRIASNTPNGASNRCSSQKSNHLETRRVYSATDGHLSPTTKETCFSKAEPEACHRTG